MTIRWAIVSVKVKRNLDTCSNRSHCDTRFELLGSNICMCQADTSWLREEPFCVCELNNIICKN